MWGWQRVRPHIVFSFVLTFNLARSTCLWPHWKQAGRFVNVHLSSAVPAGFSIRTKTKWERWYVTCCCQLAPLVSFSSLKSRPVLSLSLSPAPAASVCRLYERRDTELSPGYKCTSSFLIGVLLMTAFIFKYSKAPSGSVPGLSYPSYVTQAWWCRRPEKACRVTFLLLLTWNKLSTFWRGNMSPACDSS